VKRVVIVAALPVLLLAVWAVITATRFVDPIFLPSPLAVGKSVVSWFTSGTLLKDLGMTLWRALSGFAISALIGVPAGLIVGRFKVIAAATQPTVDFFRSVPATALFPLFLFLFGLGDKAKISIVVYACALVVLVNTAYGALQVKNARLLSAQVMGASRWDTFWKIIIPESAPGIFAGLRVALSMSFVLIIVTEMFIGTAVGLGHQIIDSQMVYRIADMYAGIVLAGVAGYGANSLLLLVEKRALHWVGH
jgi:NitT/TauT family transport system permease protein